MGAFGGLIQTNKGRNLQAKAEVGTQLKFTRMGVGDGQLGGQSIPSLNKLIHETMSLPITRLKAQLPAQAVVGAVLSSQDVTTGFFFRELGIFAQDPDEGEILYAYGNSGSAAEYIPAAGSPDIIEKTIDMIVTFGQAQNVSAVINSSLVYVTHEELAEALEGLDPDIPQASLTQPGITQLSNAINSTSDSHAATPSAVKKAHDRADQAFQAGNERKAEVVAALVAIGISASTSETWAQLIPKIAAVIRATGNATAADILAGKTASNANGPLTGSMPNRGAVLITPGPSDQAILAGYHNGAGKVAGVPVPAANVLTGTTIAGTPGQMPNRSAENHHMPGLEATVWAGDRFFIRPPGGFYTGESWVTTLVPGLTAANLRKDVNVAGLIGTLVEGRKFIQGSVTPNANGYYVIPVNGFTPSYGFMWQGDGSGDGSLNPVYMGGMPRNADGSPNLARESGPSVVVVDYAAYYTSNGFTQPNNVFFPGSVFLRVNGKMVGTAKYILFE